eukprot:2115641-Amphidinium_carterae.1
MKARVLDQSAMLAGDEAAGKSRSPSAFAATTGPVTDTCWSQLAWIKSTPCALHTQSWKFVHIRIFRICVSTGRLHTCKLYSQGNRLIVALVICQGHRQNSWRPATYRVGEARKPGPTICSTNPAGWSQVEPVLNLKHDVVAVQETFVL